MTGSWKKLGATYDPAADALSFKLFSKNATRIDLYLYDTAKGAEEKLIYPLARGGGEVWQVSVPLVEVRKAGISSVIYYGYRAWGPNWPFDPSWRKGSRPGFVTDVDNAGNRFNPNKLLLDPYAREISHDPAPRLSDIDPNEYDDDFYTGDAFRERDTGKIAPKGIAFLAEESADVGERPRRLLKDDIIYEVHLRGFTMADDAISPPLRGTFKGAALKAPYLRELGVTAVEFLPVQAFANEQNDDGDPRGDNYWGYMTLAYFAPNRRYAADKSPGGPVREFKEMVQAFHAEGIKVFLDVVFNHTAEGILKRMSDRDDSRQDDARQFPERACLLSLRGIDNASYYQLRSNAALDGAKTLQRYQDNSACGANLRVTDQVVRDLVLDVLQYWSQEMGVDGFRFDLAPVMGNELPDHGYRFSVADPGCILNRAVAELPSRSPETLQGVDLIAEPWAMGEGTYQLGRFPAGWSEWNDVFRDTLRRAENKLGVEGVMPWQLANVFSGSQQQFNGKSTPAVGHSINYLVSHDGFTLRDLYSYTGESTSWDHGGDRALQRKAVRNALAFMMVSSGVPMITGGDEIFRTLSGRTNTAGIDDGTVYLDWQKVADPAAQQGNPIPADEVLMQKFAKKMLKFRRDHIALRPATYFTGARSEETGLRDIAWYSAEGVEAGDWFWNDPNRHFIAFRIDGKRVHDPASSILVAYNKGGDRVHFNLPPNRPGERWRLVCDTDQWLEKDGNWVAETVIDGGYDLHGRSLAIFIEK